MHLLTFITEQNLVNINEAAFAVVLSPLMDTHNA